MIDDETDWAAEVVIRRSRSQMRMTAHCLFDPIWQSGLASRSSAYRLLAEELGVPEPEVHFGQMAVEQLEIAIPAIQRVKARLERKRAENIGRPQPFKRKLDIRPTAPTDNRPSFQPSRHK